MSGSARPPASAFESIRNTNPLYRRFENVRSADLRLADLTFPADRPDNGSVGDGQFRIMCQYSHFSFDDPIVFPGQPGASHLHMFYGNTGTNADTTTDSLVNHGGSTCSGFELNRSAYWSPALLDGKGNVVVPHTIIIYYKTKFPDLVQRLPQGLKMIAGNTGTGSFTSNQNLTWSCGENGHAYNLTNRIPDCGGDTINAAVVFPQCWDGVNLDSADHRSHMATVSTSKPCPASHPVRFPQISILLYYPGQESVDGWMLSSDVAAMGDGSHSGHGSMTGAMAGSMPPPGSALHADWWGGWNDETMDLWTRGCMVRARNCSLGQTGTDRQLAKISPLHTYEGPWVLPLPEGAG